MIMILTGKCKKDFVNFRLDKFSHVEFIDLPILLQNALIIEFFDSVGIFINITCSMWVFNYNILGKYPFYSADLFKTRHEATEKAIIKANKIYNENKA